MRWLRARAGARPGAVARNRRGGARVASTRNIERLLAIAGRAQSDRSRWRQNVMADQENKNNRGERQDGPPEHALVSSPGRRHPRGASPLLADQFREGRSHPPLLRATRPNVAATAP